MVFVTANPDPIVVFKDSVYYMRMNTKTSALYVERSQKVIEIVNNQTFVLVKQYNDLFGSYQQQKPDSVVECQ